MNVQLDAKNLFAPAWNSETRAPQKATKTELEKAMEEYDKARSTCDKAADTMMDEHHRTVAESAKKMDEYYKQKMLRNQAREAVKDRQELNEQVRIESINHRNMLESRKLEELDRDQLLAR